MGIKRLEYCLDDDYPTINWDRHSKMASLWLEIDERHRSDLPYDDILRRIAYQLPMNRRWDRVDFISMFPGIGVSVRARAALESLGVPGMRFLGFRVNLEPFFLFYTERVVDCLDRERSEIRYFPSSPERVMRVVSYAFTQERLRPCDLFTVPELSDGMFFWTQQTFVTDEARTILEGAGVFGIRFEPLPVPGECTEPDDPAGQGSV